MPWIPPLEESDAPEASRATADAHAATGGRMTNMKWTLAHDPAALDALLEWYPLHERVVPILGERRTNLFCPAVLYLAGEGARYVTGTTLVIDAGLLTR